jgi:hypothetical protein
MCRRVLLWRQLDKKSFVIGGRNPPKLLSNNVPKFLRNKSVVLQPLTCSDHFILKQHLYKNLEFIHTNTLNNVYLQISPIRYMQNKNVNL